MQVEEALHVLGLVRKDGALPSPEQIRRAFKQQALIWHPDKLSGRQATDTPASPGPVADPVPSQEQHTVLHPPPNGSTWGPIPAGGVDPSLAAGQEAGAPHAQQHEQHIHRNYQHYKQQQHHHHHHDQFSDKIHRGQSQQHQQHKQQGASATRARSTGPDSDPGETFKRLAAACHVLLQQRRREQQQQQGKAGVGGFQQGQWQEQEEREEAWLVDSLSAELLLQEAARLRLSDFDMMFLHMRAAALRGDLATEEGSGAGAVLGVWPDAVQSIDDILRRIRIRLERRRQRQGIPSSATSRTAAGSFRGPAASKWALLYDFVADMVAAPPDNDQQQQQQQQEEGQEQEGHGVGGSNSSTERCTVRAWGTQQGDLGLHVGTAVGGGVPMRKRGRLPRGFYLTWLRRLVVARIVWGFVRG